MGSGAKTGKNISTGHRSSFSIKFLFGIGHPPPIYQMQCICVGEVSRVPNLQRAFNYLISSKSYGIFSDFVVPVVPALSSLSPQRPCHPCCPYVVPIAPRRSPCGPHHPHRPCRLHPCCHHRPHHPHTVPVIPTSS